MPRLRHPSLTVHPIHHSSSSCTGRLSFIIFTCVDPSPGVFQTVLVTSSLQASPIAGTGENHRNCFLQTPFPYLCSNTAPCFRLLSSSSPTFSLPFAIFAPSLIAPALPLHSLPPLVFLVAGILEQVPPSRVHTSPSLRRFISLILSSFAGHEPPSLAYLGDP